MIYYVLYETKGQLRNKVDPLNFISHENLFYTLTLTSATQTQHRMATKIEQTTNTGKGAQQHSNGMANNP